MPINFRAQSCWNGGVALLFMLVFTTSTVLAKTHSRRPARTGSPYWHENIKQGDHAVIGLLGTYNSRLGSSPVALGADFHTLIQPKVAFRVGFVYWNATPSPVTVTGLDVSAGAGYIWPIKRVEVEAGGRLGYARVQFSRIYKHWSVAEDSFGTVTLEPYVHGVFKFTPEWSVGVEIRPVVYLNAGYSFLADTYILSHAQFHF